MIVLAFAAKLHTLHHAEPISISTSEEDNRQQLLQ